VFLYSTIWHLTIFRAANSIELDRLRLENLKQQNALLLAARKEIEVAQEHRGFLNVVSHELVRAAGFLDLLSA
jgi:hypothetical protein